MENLISIVIPTRNRPQTARRVLAELYRIFVNSNVEVIVFDTSDSDQLKDEECFINSNYFRYISSSTRGFCDTFDEAISYANGHFITIIGDDDLICKEVISIAQYCFDNNIDSISSKHPILYNWSDFSSVVTGKLFSSTLMISSDYSTKIIKYNLKKELFQFSHRSLLGFEHFPRIYYGLVSRESLNKLKSRYGRCFFSATPDISNAIALTEVLDYHYVIDLPLFIAGASASSGAGQSASGTHIGKIEQSAMLKPFLQNWIDIIPKLYSPETVWAFTAAETLKVINRHDLINNFNPALFFSRLIGFHPKSLRLITSVLKQYCEPMQPLVRIRILLGILFYLPFFFFVQFQKIINRFILPAFGKGITIYKNISNIEDVFDTVNLHKSSRGKF